MYFCIIRNEINLRIMKTTKTMAITIGLLLALSFTACQKEKAGVYSPKKKIQQIYYTWNGSEKKPYQHWVWDGDRLNSITHYAGFGKRYDWEEVFTYENNRLKRVDDYSDSEYITYDYDGDHLRTATVFYYNSIECTWTVGYEGNHITRLTGTFYDKNKCDHELRLNPLSHLFSHDLCARIAQCQHQTVSHRHNEYNYTLSLQLIWDGDNISKIVYSADDDQITLQMQYDDKCCPWYGFMGSLEEYLSNFQTGHTSFTKHNVTSMVYMEEYDTDTMCYAYQYDSDNYPILQTMYLSGDVDEKTVFYYEY